MLHIKKLTYRIMGRELFQEASFHLPKGHRGGLVGRNGTGKTTLFRLISGELQPDHGELSLPKGARVGMVAQEMPATEKTPLQYVLENDPQLKDLYTILEAESEADPLKVAEAHARMAEIGGYSAPAKASKILVGLGFTEEMQNQPLSSYSGGWQMRVNLAAALFSEPDLLLLDEPTNHLDFESVAWLEGFLKTYPQTILMISHDRHVLNTVVDRIYHLNHKEVTPYGGNYDFYEKTYREKMAQKEAAQATQQAQRAKIEGFVNRFRAKSSKAKQVQSRLKMLERFEPISLLRNDPTIRLRFPEPESLQPPLISLEKAKAGYGDKVVLKNLNHRIDPEDRIALLGSNGNGKSTFAKILSSVIRPLEGSIHASSKLRVGYFHQHQIESLHLEESAFDHMRALLPEMPEDRLRARLGQFGFGKDKSEVAVKKLSGGEKARLNFALVSCQKPNILILDEPTNHLDVDTRDSLVFAINQFKGAVVLITHDWSLLELTADTFWIVQDQQVLPFDGDLRDYQRQVLGSRGFEKMLKNRTEDSRAAEIRAKKAKKKKKRK